jgi:hypothetical protein
MKAETNPTKDFIFEAMERYYTTCGCDRYGQIKTIDVYSVFKDRTNEVLEYLKEDRLINIATYGWQYGTYKGFTPWAINDAKLVKVCSVAFRNNPSRNNMNQW